MGKLATILGYLRLGALIAGNQKVKGVPISVIAEEAEKDGKIIADSVKRIKDAKKKPAVSGSTGE